MKSMKGSIRMISILSIFTLLGVLIPMITDASVDPNFVDFGKVEIGSSSTRTLCVTNTNNVRIDIALYIVGDTCGFSINLESISLGAGESGFIEVSYTPPEPNSCSNTLIVEIIDSQESVPLTGTGIVPPPPIPPPPPPPPPPPSSPVPRTIKIGDFDTGIVDTLYEGQLISEGIEQCASEAKNHGKFVSCVAHLTNDVKREGIITEEEMSAIQKYAARAKIP